MNLKDMIPAKHLDKGRWWDKTVTAIEGCTRVSPACDHCWAEAGANMRQHNPNAKVAARHEGLLTDGKYNGRIRLMHDDILKPLHWAKPSVIAWWNDLFHEDVPFEFIDRIMAVIALTPQHVHIICTKRAERSWEYYKRTADQSDPSVFGDSYIGNNINGLSDYLLDEVREKPGGNENWFWNSDDYGSEGRLEVPGWWEYKGEGDVDQFFPWPPKNLVLMTTAENQAMADLRIPWLLKTPAAVRAVAIEPMLGPVDLRVGASRRNRSGMFVPCPACGGSGTRSAQPGEHGGFDCRCSRCDGAKRVAGLDWVILGGETGKGARPMRYEWAAVVRDQCEAAGVPFLFKRWGPRNALAGRLLDGRLHDGYPEVSHA
jgi:protein gp37